MAPTPEYPAAKEICDAVVKYLDGNMSKNGFKRLRDALEACDEEKKNMVILYFMATVDKSSSQAISEMEQELEKMSPRDKIAWLLDEDFDQKDGNA
jgi:hypothetical protein